MGDGQSFLLGGSTSPLPPLVPALNIAHILKLPAASASYFKTSVAQPFLETPLLSASAFTFKSCSSFFFAPLEQKILNQFSSFYEENKSACLCPLEDLLGFWWSARWATRRNGKQILCEEVKIFLSRGEMEDSAQLVRWTWRCNLYKHQWCTWEKNWQPSFTTSYSFHSEVLKMDSGRINRTCVFITASIAQKSKGAPPFRCYSRKQSGRSCTLGGAVFLSEFWSGDKKQIRRKGSSPLTIV